MNGQLPEESLSLELCRSIDPAKIKGMASIGDGLKYVKKILKVILDS